MPAPAGTWDIQIEHKPVGNVPDPDIGGRVMVPDGHSVEGFLTGEPLRVFVHYAAGRSWPCTGRGCCLCKTQIAKRFYSYYPVANEKGQKAIFELTANTEAQLLSQMTPVSDVPCGHIYIKRGGGRRNAPCVVTWKESDNNHNGAGTTQTLDELKSSLMKIWCLPEQSPTSTEAEHVKIINQIIRLKIQANS